MEGTKRRAANSLGMFDLLKGVGMLTIVFAHTGELYPMGDASHINPLTFCMFAYRESLMAAFYIASGYGFLQALHRQVHRPAVQNAAQALHLYRHCHHRVPFYHPLQSVRQPAQRHLRDLQGAGRLCTGPAPHGHLFRPAVLLLRPHVVSALADDRMDPAGSHPEYLPGAVHKLGGAGYHAVRLGHLYHLGGSFLHRPGHGHRSGSVCGLPRQEV